MQALKNALLIQQQQLKQQQLEVAERNMALAAKEAAMARAEVEAHSSGGFNNDIGRIIVDWVFQFTFK